MTAISQSLYSSNYSSESIRRKTVGLTIRIDLLQTAREKGINLSKLFENTLIQTLEAQNSPFSPNRGYVDAQSASHPQDWCSGRDLNPGRRLSPKDCASRGRHT